MFDFQGKRASLSVSVTLTMFLASAPFIGVFFYLGKFWVSTCLSIVDILFLTFYFLGKQQKIWASTIGTLLLANICTFYFNSVLGNATQIYVLFFPFVIVPLVVIDSSKKLIRAGLTMLPIIGYGITHFTTFRPFFSDPLPPHGNMVVHFGVYIATFTILILVEEFLFRENEFFQKALIKSNSELKVTNIQLTAQTELLEVEKAEKEVLLEQQIKLTDRLKVEAGVREEFYQKLSEKSVESEARKVLAEQNALKESELRVEFEKQAIELKKKMKLEQDLMRAQKMQERILPKTFPDSEDVFMDAFFVPVRYLSGDYWTWRYVGEDKRKIIVVLADVMGKAADASISSLSMAQKINDYFEANDSRLLSVHSVFNFIRKVASKDIMLENKSVSLAVVLIDLDSKTFEWANAGLEPLHYVTYEQNELNTVYLEAQNLALGMEEDDILVQTFSYEHGGMLLGFTDGVLDLKNPKNERLDPDGVEQMKRGVLNEDLRSIVPLFLEKLITYQGDIDQADDMTLVLIKF